MPSRDEAAVCKSCKRPHATNRAEWIGDSTATCFYAGSNMHERDQAMVNCQWYELVLVRRQLATAEGRIKRLEFKVRRLGFRAAEAYLGWRGTWHTWRATRRTGANSSAELRAADVYTRRRQAVVARIHADDALASAADGAGGEGTG